LLWHRSPDAIQVEKKLLPDPEVVANEHRRLIRLWTLAST